MHFLKTCKGRKPGSGWDKYEWKESAKESKGEELSKEKGCGTGSMNQSNLSHVIHVKNFSQQNYIDW